MDKKPRRDESIPLVRVDETSATVPADETEIEALAGDLRERLVLSQEQRLAIRAHLAHKPADVPDERVMPWESQARQYPEKGEPGFEVHVPDLGGGVTVNCLLYRDDDGSLAGILNHYPVAIPPWQAAGTINVWVRPDRRGQGIGKKLGLGALHRGWSVDLEALAVTGTGRSLLQSVHRMLQKDVEEEAAEPDE